jgi:hypothetical protein
MFEFNLERGRHICGLRPLIPNDRCGVKRLGKKLMDPAAIIGLGAISRFSRPLCGTEEK